MAKPVKTFKAKKTQSKCVKMKTKRAAQKRYKVLASGLVKVGCAAKRHLTGKKPRHVKNKLRRGKVLGPESRFLVTRCLPYSKIT